MERKNEASPYACGRRRECGADAEMTAYSYLFHYRDRLFMPYRGKGVLARSDLAWQSWTVR